MENALIPSRASGIEKIVNIKCGDFQTVLTDQCNDFYFCGTNNRHQCMLGYDECLTTADFYKDVDKDDANYIVTWMCFIDSEDIKQKI